jgi:hypothetical protein
MWCPCVTYRALYMLYMLCGLQVLAHVDAAGVPLEDAVSAVSRAGADTVAFLEGLLERLASGGERRRVKIAKVLGNLMLFHHPEGVEGVLQYRSKHGKLPLPLSISFATMHFWYSSQKNVASAPHPPCILP